MPGNLVLRHLPVRHMHGHVLKHVPCHVLKHVPCHVLKHVPDRHLPEHVPRHVIEHVPRHVIEHVLMLAEVCVLAGKIENHMRKREEKKLPEDSLEVNSRLDPETELKILCFIMHFQNTSLPPELV